jgi:hypothetical protein
MTRHLTIILLPHKVRNSAIVLSYLITRDNGRSRIQQRKRAAFENIQNVRMGDEEWKKGSDHPFKTYKM